MTDQTDRIKAVAEALGYDKHDNIERTFVVRPIAPQDFIRAYDALRALEQPGEREQDFVGNPSDRPTQEAVTDSTERRHEVRKGERRTRPGSEMLGHIHRKGVVPPSGPSKIRGSGDRRNTPRREEALATMIDKLESILEEQAAGAMPERERRAKLVQVWKDEAMQGADSATGALVAQAYNFSGRGPTLLAALTELVGKTGEKPMTTTRVRIAVAIWPSGEWHCFGGGKASDADLQAEMEQFLADDGYTVRWIEADVPIPTKPPDLPVIEGEIDV